jgi:GNAT superfamily N-acetyltransferase
MTNMPNQISSADMVVRLGANYVDTFRSLARIIEGGEVLESGSVSLVATGLPAAPFNIAFVRGPLADPDAELSRAVTRFQTRKLPFLIRFFVPTDPATSATAKALRLVDAPAQPGMAMSNAVAAGTSYAGLRIVCARDGQTLQHHADVCARGFTISPDIMGRLISPALLRMHDVEIYVGYVDGAPVTSSALFLNNGVAGIYNVATVDSHRRTGLGAAMTWHAVQRGRELGCQFSGLLSSVMGQPVYERMGFRTITSYPTLGVQQECSASAATQA